MSGMANFVNNKNASKSSSISSGSKYFGRQPLGPIALRNKWKIGKDTSGQVVAFLIKTIALETLRRLSKARYPFIWTGLQALQVLCYPPLKWIQCWKPFGFLVKGMQMLSRPLLVLSIVDAFSEFSDCKDHVPDDNENSLTDGDSQVGSESHSVSAPLEGNHSLRNDDEDSQGPLSTDWMLSLHKELEKQGITLPERINKEELQRFYVAANGDFSSLLSSVKNTIRWRETYGILSGEELEIWSNLIFWHGLDIQNRPCLILRLGLVCTSLPSHDRPRFAQAVVSQVEHGVLYLVNEENPQITVIVDCQGLLPLKFPMQMLRHCCNLLQDHFPNVLGSLIVIRLPPVVRVIAQTFIQVLKPATKQKLRIEGASFRKVLSECLQTIPSYLGGQCTCIRCAKLDTSRTLQISDRQTSPTESVSDIPHTENFQSIQPNDMATDDSNCSGILRSAVIGILIIWVLFALIGGLLDPESRPILPF